MNFNRIIDFAMGINLVIPTLGNRFVDYRQEILGDSFNFGPAINASQVKYFAFHHSVTPQTAKKDGNWKAECDKIADFHVNENGWAGVGYRFIICSNGVVVYVGDLSHGGAAVKNHNDVIFSACMVGDFTKELPTDIQINSAHDLADFFLNSLPQYPLIKDWNENIIGHKDAATIFNDPSIATACPGSSWPVDIKDRIKNNIVYTPQPLPPLPVDLPPHSGSGTGPTPTPEPTPSNCSVYIDREKKIKDVLYGKGFWWTKLNKVKALLPK